MTTKFSIFLTLLGLYVMVPKLLFILRFLAKLTRITNRRPLLDKFKAKTPNEAPWALITGCTAGIGEEMTYRFAEQGLNLVLVARNRDKANKVAEEDSRRSHGKALVRIVIVDLSKSAMDLERYSAIAQEVCDIDLAIIVNNAGVAYDKEVRV